jgi:hypothetical protein
MYASKYNSRLSDSQTCRKDRSVVVVPYRTIELVSKVEAYPQNHHHPNDSHNSYRAHNQRRRSIIDFHGVAKWPSILDDIPDVMNVDQGPYNKKNARVTFDGAFRLWDLADSTATDTAVI